MHDESSEGQAFFKCDFCGQSWTDDRPMVEGHRGALICANCLSIAYAELTTSQSQSLEPAAPVISCTLCLEDRDQPAWTSPINEEAVICLRCVKQSATVLEKDVDQKWRRPG